MPSKNISTAVPGGTDAEQNRRCFKKMKIPTQSSQMQALGALGGTHV